MPTITKITEQKSNSERLNVFIDDSFCTGVRKRTFQAMELKVGDSISCKELIERENYFWKNTYNQASWEREKDRIQKVSEYISSIDDRIVIEVVGFGANSEEFIKAHPDIKGSPDLNLRHKHLGHSFMKVEVTGTEKKRGEGYWVRPDKLEFVKNNPKEDAWLILHYSDPEEIVLIKPSEDTDKKVQNIEIRGATEKYCVFNKGDQEIKDDQEFRKHIKEALDEIDQLLKE